MGKIIQTQKMAFKAAVGLALVALVSAENGEQGQQSGSEISSISNDINRILSEVNQLKDRMNGLSKSMSSEYTKVNTAIKEQTDNYNHKQDDLKVWPAIQLFLWSPKMAYAGTAAVLQG